MTLTPLARIARLLGEVRAAGSFAARRTAASDDLHLEVKGVGLLRLPVSRLQAEQLCRIARPARYGQGEQTLLDRRVRDTWEVPRSRVKIDRRRWNRTLVPVLEALHADLGLPDGSSLKADLHSMLVYAPGQFFARHQDSEKADDMVGTLVVTLPGAFTGGALVVEHQGEKVSSRASKNLLSFFAFYADCHHEVRPVTDGFRVVLTYNLMLESHGAATVAPAAPALATVEALVRSLREHFETPLPPAPHAPDDALPEPPSRLVYLLDHQYTERGLGWNRLKGNDAARVAALQAAAERAGCEVVLALAEVQETWSCFEDSWDDPWFHRGRRWELDEDDEGEADSPLPPDAPERYQLEELVDWSITLHRWLDASGADAEAIASDVDLEEVCATTPSVDLQPYASQYEGYMGNYGNTMDRWYRRGALVVWPRERAFAVRAKASPAWALETIEQRLRAGAIAEAREMAASLQPFWPAVGPREEGRRFFNKALRVAEGLDRPALAASLLQPFRVEALAPGGAPAFVALVARYGEGWARSLLAEWSDDRRVAEPDRLQGLATLPRLGEALRAADEGTGTLAARLLLQDRWTWLGKEIAARRRLARPSERDAALAELAEPLLGWLRGAAVVAAADLQEDAVAVLCAEENEALLPSLVEMLRTSAASEEAAERDAPALDEIGRHCRRLLTARLEVPARSAEDWSIAPPEDCRCELCSRLGSFLSDPDTRRLEWPLAKPGRRHAHEKIDRHEIPVRHQTRRSGRPFTLILEKTEALFEREATERRRWREDLAWLGARTAP